MGKPPDEDATASAPRLPSVYQVSRQLKKERNSLYNCLCSIIDDSLFIAELRSLYPGVPVLANLRCGLWYTSEPDDTCYFKSTDGHMGNWSFSTTRLNLHVADWCAAQGGIILVDATRNAHKGGYPDALSKTVPIWATIVNRAIARVRAGCNQQPGAQQASSHLHTRVHTPYATAESQIHHKSPGDSPDDDTDTFQFDVPRIGLDPRTSSAPPLFPQQPPAPVLAATEWDTDLHLPLWITSNEIKQVEARLEGWVDQLLATRLSAIQQLAKDLHKPLRPLWISQSSRIWVNEVAQPHELDFTPLYLVTASRPVHGERRCCPYVRRLMMHAQHTAECQEPSCEGPEALAHQGSTYLYVPGAGDDEESWAAGLTPALMWQHHEALMEAGPSGVHSLVQHIIKSDTAGGKRCADMARPRGSAAETGLGGSGVRRGSAGVVTDEHHLAPEGCRSAGSGSVHHLGQGAYLIAGTQLVLAGREGGQAPGVWGIAGAVLYCGSQPYEYMTHSRWLYKPIQPADHMCTCLASLPLPCSVHTASSQPPSSPGGLTEQDMLRVYGPSHAYSLAATEPEVHTTGLATVQCELYSVDSLSASGISPCASSLQLATDVPSVFTSSQPGVQEAGECDAAGVCDARAAAPPHNTLDAFAFNLETVVDLAPPDYISVNLQLDSQQRLELRAEAQRAEDEMRAAGSGNHQQPGGHSIEQPRSLWLPISSAKQGKGSLQASLQDALTFVMHHLAAGRRVLIHDDEGVDQCVCMAVAVMLCCQLTRDMQEAKRPAVSKAIVRHTLAQLAGSYPHARPTRGLLKQVFAFFHAACAGTSQQPTGHHDV